ncbi:MAG TPA: DNA topoisomerase IB [Solirubrobacteraceae bacterium]|jgi:DNA topoisomerase IB
MASGKRTPRLRRSDCSGPGLRRRRSGRGFSFLTDGGGRVTDRETLERVRSLAIPPAWQEVWICQDPLGHLQATGIDAAGRKQYLYHPRWRDHRDRQKFQRMMELGAVLPTARRRIRRDLKSEGLMRERVLAGAARLLDVGMFRIGSEEYADEEGGIGLATLQQDNVSIQEGRALFDYLAKRGLRRVQVIEDPLAVEIVTDLRRRRAGGTQLLAYREGRRWHDVRSSDINEYLKQQLGEEFSAKDFRTWNGTVMAAVGLAADARAPTSGSGRKRAIKQAVGAVAELLGNTPTVARRAYIDPRVFDRYQSGWTIAGELERLPSLDPTDDRVRARIEAAVLDLLADRRESPALEHG